MLDPSREVQLLYSQQSTTLSPGGSAAPFDLTIRYLHLGGTSFVDGRSGRGLCRRWHRRDAVQPQHGGYGRRSARRSILASATTGRSMTTSDCVPKRAASPRCQQLGDSCARRLCRRPAQRHLPAVRRHDRAERAFLRWTTACAGARPGPIQVKHRHSDVQEFAADRPVVADHRTRPWGEANARSRRRQWSPNAIGTFAEA